MRLSLTDDQILLARTASAFVATKSPLSRARKLRNDGNDLLYSQTLWTEMAELGWAGIPFSHSDGGAGLGLVEAAIVAESLGRCLAPEPFLSTFFAGRVLAFAGTESQRHEWLRSLITGKRTLALAYQERGERYGLYRGATRLEHAANGRYRLTGTKVHVIGGRGADAVIVAAAMPGESTDACPTLTLVLVPTVTNGVAIVPQHRIDSRNAAIVHFNDVDLPKSAIVGHLDGGAGVLSDAIDHATVILCAEMLGAMTEALNRTLAYVKERVQFGVVVGTFQALKHRLARMYIEAELARSASFGAARAIDSVDPNWRALVSAAKARCSDAYTLIANEAIQMHGGIGMTDEHDIGFFIKHARTAEMTFGDAAYHRDRFATLGGF